MSRVLILLLFAPIVSATTLRNPETVRSFKYLHPCPSTGLTHGGCPGWIVDHILPLGCNGPDAVDNMQWQTVRDAHIKDRWEIKGNLQHKPCSGDAE